MRTFNGQLALVTPAGIEDAAGTSGASPVSPESPPPEPVLLIIGRNPRASWSASAMVTTRSGERVSLLDQSGPKTR